MEEGAILHQSTGVIRFLYLYFVIQIVQLKCIDRGRGAGNKLFLCKGNMTFSFKIIGNICRKDLFFVFQFFGGWDGAKILLARWQLNQIFLEVGS